MRGVENFPLKPSALRDTVAICAVIGDTTAVFVCDRLQNRSSRFGAARAALAGCLNSERAESCGGARIYSAVKEFMGIFPQGHRASHSGFLRCEAASGPWKCCVRPGRFCVAPGCTAQRAASLRAGEVILETAERGSQRT